MKTITPDVNKNSQHHEYLPLQQSNGMWTCVCGYELIKADENTWECTGGGHEYHLEQGDMIVNKYGQLCVRIKEDQ